MNRRTTMGFPNAGSARENLLDAAALLGTVAIPGPSTVRVGHDASDWRKVAGVLVSTMSPGRGGLLDLGDAFAGAQQTFLTRQVTLTDFCYPDSEQPGAVLMTLRHQLDVNCLAVQSTPAGRDPRGVETAWFDLSEVAAVAVNRIDSGGVRPSIVALSFLAAARSCDYRDRCAAEALRTHVISNSECRRASDRLDRFSGVLVAMVRSRAFPHRLMAPLGGLLSWTSQREIASVTAVARGPQEGVKTEMTDAPRSSVNVPACVYMDADEELKMQTRDAGFSVVYLVFVYGQKAGRETVRVHVVRSRMPETAFKSVLELLFSRLRASNAIHGNEDAKVAQPTPEANFPLLPLYRQSRSRDGRSQRIADLRRAAGAQNDGKYVWRVDARNRPSPNSCMYAAYCRLGYMDDISSAHRKSRRCGSVDVPTVYMTGLAWNIGQWVECY